MKEKYIIVDSKMGEAWEYDTLPDALGN